MSTVQLKKEIWDVLRSIRENTDVVFRPIIEEQGLTMMQTRILVEIKQQKHPTVGSLCDGIGLTSGNASAACKKLEKAGFLKRTRDPNDERCVELSLTQQGDDAIDRIDEGLEERYSLALQDSYEKELEDFLLCMKRFNAIMNEMSTIEKQR